ncbi:MAG: hypothetical protein K1X75_09675 [Leptospirales bacterium]|nr:hypothetical protein [Leptospirales bacterium]
MADHRTQLKTASAPLLAAAVLWTLGAKGLAAETIQFRDGTEVQGRVVGFSRTHVTAIIDGQSQTISKYRLARIRYDVLNSQAAEDSPAERERLQRTRGVLVLHSGMRLSGQAVERDDPFLVFEAESGKFRFRLDEVDYMLLSKEVSGHILETRVPPEGIEAIRKATGSDSRILLQSGQRLQAESGSFDGDFHSVETELGRLRLSPDDLAAARAAPAPLARPPLAEGQWGIVRLSSGQELYGQLRLKGPHQWVLQTASGELLLRPEEILRSWVSEAPPSGWPAQVWSSLRSLFGAH